jgi:hypothetical protein
MQVPPTDPTPIFDLFRGNHATELLTVAVAHFELFARVGDGRPEEALRRELGLSARAGAVLFTALRAMKLLASDAEGRLTCTPLARAHLLPESPFDVGGYVALAAESPGVLALRDRLTSDRPAAQPGDDGLAFIYREGLESAMEAEQSARRLTLSLAGRARNVAPVLAARQPLDGARLLLDVGGGSGLYAIAYLQRHPTLRAIVWDRPEVLKVAADLAQAEGVADRLACVPGDMFADPVPAGADVALLSNVLHDWDVPACRALVGRCAAALPAGGRLVVHEPFLDDGLDGPLPVALYSAALFALTEGRAYSAAECRAWLEEAGLATTPPAPTLVHCAALVGRK